MTKAFTAMLATVSASVPPAPGSILQTLTIEACKFERVNLALKVDTTSDAECQLAIAADYSECLTQLFELEALGSEIVSWLCYKHLRLIACEPAESRLTLRFVTIPSSENYFVSGCVDLICSNYKLLFAEYLKLQCR